MKRVGIFVKGVMIGFFTPWRTGKVIDDTAKVLVDEQRKRVAKV